MAGTVYVDKILTDTGTTVNVSGVHFSKTGNVTFTGTSSRIFGDFSNATTANRVLFQSSTANGVTQLSAIPNGTGTQSGLFCFDASDTANNSWAAIRAISATDMRLQSGTTGTGTYLPMTFYTGGSEAMRIDTAGNVGIGTSTPAQKLHISGAGSTYTSVTSTNASTGAGAFYINNTSTWLIGAGPASGSSEFAIIDQTSGSNVRMRIDSTGFTQFPGNLVMPYQGAPTSKSGAATLTGAELVTGILNTTGTTYTITLPTGTIIEGALTWSANNVSLDWYVINTASGTITIGANGNTTLGSLTIATGTSAHFRIRKTAVNTFTVYRL